MLKKWWHNKIVYQRDEIDSTYNYFVFDTSGGYTVTLKNHRAGDTTEWDGLTDWGDGTINSELTHTYTTDGAYIVKTKWMINDSFSGDTETKQMFIACNNINKNITDVTYLFSDCSYLRSVDMSRFRTKNITDMSYMFRGCSSLESVNMKGWNTSNVTNMKYMFYNCTKLTPEVSHFDVSNVTDMKGMFESCGAIDGSQFKNWDVSSVTNMVSMFYYSHTTNCLDLSGWDVSNVNNFSYMFNYCQANNGYDISYWNINDDASTYYMIRNTHCATCININHHVKHDGVPTADWERMIADNEYV